jgi:hypothetical protein
MVVGMTTMHNRERMRGYQAHNDLLSQVADSTEERDNVRRILGGLTEADLDAQQAWKRSPWPYSPANHAHRHSACSGPCEQGRRPCPCPDSCQEPERDSPRAGDLLRTVALFLAAWAVVATVLLGVAL